MSTTMDAHISYDTSSYFKHTYELNIYNTLGYRIKTQHVCVYNWYSLSYRPQMCTRIAIAVNVDLVRTMFGPHEEISL